MATATTLRPMPVAAFPARGTYAEGFEPVVQTFTQQLARGEEVGASLAITHDGALVVDLHGGLADVRSGQPWSADSRVVVFSVTKGLAAMAFALLGDRGRLDWDAPVATWWPGFARAGKGAITPRVLLGHRGGLAALDTPLALADFLAPERRAAVVDALEAQAPLWFPGRGQAYHALTWGMYAAELFERIAGESLGTFLRRELFEPLDADARLGTPPELDAHMATLYPPSGPARVRSMVGALLRGDSTEARLARAFFTRGSLPRRAFTNPPTGRLGMRAYDATPARRGELAWASATSTARGIARAYLPFALGGSVGGRRYLSEASLRPIYQRQGWSERDGVLQKALGWSQGFLKEETTVFSPNPESFGHSGLGGALGWADPVTRTTLGYAMNHLDWRIRSPRAVALCHALYRCEPLRDRRGGAPGA